MLPVKLISPHSFKSGNVSFTSALPFSSSAPLFTIATFGLETPTKCSIYTEPILANCTRWEDLTSTLAPQSTSSDTPFSVGKRVASGDLSTPLIGSPPAGLHENRAGCRSVRPVTEIHRISRFPVLRKSYFIDLDILCKENLLKKKECEQYVL